MTPGRCGRCGLRVDAGAGFASRQWQAGRSKWRVLHEKCEEAERAEIMARGREEEPKP